MASDSGSLSLAESAWELAMKLATQTALVNRQPALPLRSWLVAHSASTKEFLRDPALPNC